MMRRRGAGFTLIELLVAITIFAIMGTIAYSSLESVTRQRARNQDVMKRLRQVQLAMDIVSRDFEQLAPRPVRDGLGGVMPALVAGPENVPPIEFTRGGWSNPLGMVRSTQERVAYTLEDGKLMRSWWPELDGSVAGDPAKQELLPDVTSIKIQYYDPSAGAFADTWPVAVSGQVAPPTQLPTAVSITLTLKDWGEVKRIVEVASCTSAKLC
jgi:general secretion pathway protein J